MAQQDTVKTLDLGTCAVTGSSGWFASFVVSQLTQNGYQVHCLDINPPPTVNKEINPYFPIDETLAKFHSCDIANYEQVVSALKGVNTVFHVCSITDIRVCPVPEMERVNVDGTATLLKACKECNVKQFVYTSSIEAINDGTIKDQATEDVKWAEGYNAYGTTKTLSEKLLLKQSA
eukprot:206314_1